MDRRQINLIVIHCSASPNGRATSVDDIDAWHRARGFERKQLWRQYLNPGLTSIGYHYVIDVDGTVYTGRHPDEIGAHAKGNNSRSLGVCMIGTDKFSLKQWQVLRDLVQKLSRINNGADIKGHRELPDVHKDCPGFPVGEWVQQDMGAFSGHILLNDGVRTE